MFTELEIRYSISTAIIKKEQLEVNKLNTEQSIDVNVRTGVLRLINEMSNINLSEISEQTAKEFNVPYYDMPSYFGAIQAHLRQLKIMGRQEPI